MDKYDGMNRVDARVTENDEVRNPAGKAERKGAGGFIKTLAVQLGIAVVLGGTLFAGKTYGGAWGKSATQKVKEAVCFDAFDYVAEWIKKD